MTDREKAKNELMEVKEDTQKLRIELSESNTDSRSKGRKVYDYLAKHNKKLLLVFGSIGFLSTAVLTDFEVPEIAWVGVASILVSTVIGYPYTKMVAKWFIKDKRKPILEIDPENLYDVSLWLGPAERMGEIEFINGEPNDIRTKERGTGIEVQHFEIVEKEAGDNELYAEGTWLGTKSGSELKRNISNIQSMKAHLEPLAMVGYAYKIKWPFIMRSLTQEITNAIVHDFQGITTYRGSEMNSHVENIIKKFSPKKVQDHIGEDSSSNQESDSLKTNGKNGNPDIEELAEIAGVNLEDIETEQ